jgi:hypothetical protein
VDANDPGRRWRRYRNRDGGEPEDQRTVRRSDANTDAHGDRDGDSDSDGHSHSDRYGYGHADRDADTDPDGDTWMSGGDHTVEQPDGNGGQLGFVQRRIAWVLPF